MSGDHAGEEIVEEDYRYEYETRVIGKEDLEVPARKFTGCVRVEIVGESLVGGRFGSEKVIIWYHPEVGMLKYE